MKYDETQKHGFLSRLRHWRAHVFPRRFAWPAREITLPGGRHFHLIGSIHMGCPAMTPLPAGLLRQLQQADLLIVEADLSRQTTLTLTARPAGALSDRLGPLRWQQLVEYCRQCDLAPETLATLPCWHSALTLQAAQARLMGLSPAWGIDLQLIQAARQLPLPLMELEGLATQLALLEQLPEDGYDLLCDTLDQWQQNARLLQRLISAWLGEGTFRRTPLTLASTWRSTLTAPLLINRNQRWCETLCALPRGRYVVATGALHLFGPHNLYELLKQRQRSQGKRR